MLLIFVSGKIVLTGGGSSCRWHAWCAGGRQGTGLQPGQRYMRDRMAHAAACAARVLAAPEPTVA